MRALSICQPYAELIHARLAYTHGMLRTILLTISLTIITGCAATSPPVVQQPKAVNASPAAPSTQSAKMKKPFMFGEAKLPNQFPAPGPVGEILIKQYPAARAAMVQAGSKRDNQNSLFMPLFNHIKSHHIAMSSPVEMIYSTTAPVAQLSAMAFFYGNTTIGQTGKDGSVEVMNVPSSEYVSIGVRGSYDAAHLKTALSQLHGWLGKHPQYKIIGPPRYLGYNSPFVPFFLRYGEVQLPVSG